MGFLNSLKSKISSKDEHSQAADDSKHLYQPQMQSPEIHYDTPRSYRPPLGPPPSQTTPSKTETNPPPYESWLAIPDTSQLPPPPALSNEYSSANNASFQSAVQGHRWCAQHPIYTPVLPRNSSLLESSQAGQLSLDPPPHHFKGTITPLETQGQEQGQGQSYRITTPKSQDDVTLTSALPIYFAAASNPLLRSSPSSESAAQPITFSLSVTPTKLHPQKTTLALGVASKPYPPFRLPGWHRGSLAVHSDDGNRYTNDPHGGIDFTLPFTTHETITLSVTIHPRPSPTQSYRGKFKDVRPVQGGSPKCVVRVEVIKTKKETGSGSEGESVSWRGGWDVHEERDGEKDEGVEGLQGDADLYAAIGICGEVDCVLKFGGVEVR